jgi:aspartate aminotransferase
MLLNDPQMKQEWIRDIKTMAGRIIEMREALYDQLVNKLKTPGDWKHITNQIGMFSFTGLNLDQCKKMVDVAHVYMTGNGELLQTHIHIFISLPLC